MSYNFNVEGASECIKVIVELNRCAICDDIYGTRARFPCGHSACDKCALKAAHCLLCLTPICSTLTNPIDDLPSTKRADNASTLLKNFHEAFKVDVYKRHRLSEKLKLEKEVFPECIQAPIKYYNKRKSLIPNKNKNKENRGPSFFLGEQVSPVKKRMENSLTYVQQWLDKNETKLTPKHPRKPFADLNTNQTIPRRADKILEKVKENNASNLKRKKPSHFKSTLSVVQSQSKLDQYLKPVQKNEDCKRIKVDSVKNVETDRSKDESGIVLDEDTIIIDDSQSMVVDKDKQAWLAVLEANERDPYTSSQQLNIEDSNIKNITETNEDTTTVIHKVPFYKKGYLIGTSSLCKQDKQEQRLNMVDYTGGQSKDVSVTIESNNFTTTIYVSTIKNKPTLNKISAHVQTDIKEIVTFEEKAPEGSEDLFTAEARQQDVKTSRDISPLVIADSDSDDALNESSIIQVTADVHRSFELERDTLAELGHGEVQERAKRSGRGITPNSSNSSDKENFDPNKGKRRKPLKKKQRKEKCMPNFQFE